METSFADLLVWAFSAFWLWLGLAALLRKLGVPLPQLGAALLGWIGAGLVLPWTLPLLQHLLTLWIDASRWLLR